MGGERGGRFGCTATINEEGAVRGVAGADRGGEEEKRTERERWTVKMRNNTGDKQSTSAGAEKMSESRRERERKWNEGLRHSFTSPAPRQSSCMHSAPYWQLIKPGYCQIHMSHRWVSLHFSPSEDDNKDLGCISLCTVSTGVLGSVLKHR